MDSQQLATILAALRYYQRGGQGDPANRTDEIHEIATANDDVISLDDAGIDELCELLNTGPLGLFLPFTVRYSGKGKDWTLPPVPAARFVTLTRAEDFAKGESLKSSCTWEVLGEQETVLRAFKAGQELPGGALGPLDAQPDSLGALVAALDSAEYYVSQSSGAGVLLIRARLLREARAALRSVGRVPRGEAMVKTADLER